MQPHTNVSSVSLSCTPKLVYIPQEQLLIRVQGPQRIRTVRISPTATATHHIKPRLRPLQTVSRVPDCQRDRHIKSKLQEVALRQIRTLRPVLHQASTILLYHPSTSLMIRMEHEPTVTFLSLVVAVLTAE